MIARITEPIYPRTEVTGGEVGFAFVGIRNWE